MADAQAVGQTTDSLFKKLFDPDKLWSCGSFIDTMQDNPIGSIITLAYTIAAIVWAIQILGIVINQIRVGGDTLGAELLGHVARLGVFVMFMSGYNLLIKLIVMPANLIANGISKLYMKEFTDAWVNLFDRVANGSGAVLSILQVTIDGSLISVVIASIIFFIACICAFITPLLQEALFMLAYFSGPICLAFMLSDFTASIAQRWFGFALSIAFVGVIGSLTFLAAGTMGVYSVIGEDPTLKNVIIISVYGIISIILFASALPISQYLFGGGGIGNLTSPQAAGKGAMGAAAIAVGAGAGGAVAAGAVMKKMGTNAAAGSLGAKVGAAGDKMMKFGGNTSKMLDQLPSRSPGLSAAKAMMTAGNMLGGAISSMGNNKGGKASQPPQRFPKEEPKTPSMKA